MELIDVVRKLAGPIVPVGETNEDERRYENLEKTLQMMETLLFDIQKVAHYYTRQEYSMNKAGKKALQFLRELEEFDPGHTLKEEE